MYGLNDLWDKDDFMGLMNLQRPLKLTFIGKRYEGKLGAQDLGELPQLFKPMRVFYM